MGSTLEYLRTEKRDDILRLADQHGIENVRVFGSVVRGEDNPESDIDFLISLGENRTLDDWFDFWDGAEDLLGKEIDVVKETNLHWFLKPQILAEAKPL